MTPDILITGCAGRVGSALMEHFGDRAHGTETFGDRWLELYETVIHCAIDWSSWRASLNLSLDLIEQARRAQVRRIIFPSSLSVDEASGLCAWNEGSAMKSATEGYLKAWSIETGGHACVLRLGAFRVAEARFIELTERGLAYWIDRAMSAEGFTIYTATGDGP